ncbi:hypothetical protein EES42_42675 [Streptomyces sp. ADI95-17]|nr:hypothetical protein EES42_42675 [Streptomyces sp. ADI95-17]
MFQGGASRGERVADVQGAGLVCGDVVQVGEEFARLCLERLAGRARDEPGDDRQGPVLPGPVGGGSVLARGRLLDDDVRVRAAHAEGGDARAARLPGLRPLHRLGQQLDGPGRPVHVRRRLVDVEGAGQGRVPQRHHHLDHTGDARGSLRVTEVGLHRAEEQRSALRPVLAVRLHDGLGLDGVTEDGAGAVCLHGVDLHGREAGVGQRGPDDPPLRGAVRRGQAVAGAVLVHGRAADHREDLASVAEGVGEPLHHQDTHALGPAGAVGGGREGLAAAVRREAALLAELRVRAGVVHHGHTCGQREGALALAQCLHRLVEGDQRRRARRVDRHGRALQAQGVGDPSGDDASCGAGDVVARDVLVRLPQARLVPGRLGSDEDAGRGAAQRRGGDSCPLQGLPGLLQEHTLLRVHRQRLARRDPEEARVEVRDPVDEAALEGDRVVVGLLVESLQVPAAVGREPVHRVGPGRDQVPQALGARHPARVAAAHPGDRDRFARRIGELGVLPPQPVDLFERRAQRFENLVSRTSHHALHTSRIIRIRRRPTPSGSGSRRPSRRSTRSRRPRAEGFAPHRAGPRASAGCPALRRP